MLIRVCVTLILMTLQNLCVFVLDNIMDRIETKTRIIMELKMALRYGHGVSPLELHRRVVNSEKGTPFGACINELVQRDVILSSYRITF